MAETLTHKTFQFQLVSPERVVAAGEAVMVVVPGDIGDFGVLANHAPLLSSVRPGVVVVHAPSGETKKIFVTGGFADVNDKQCSILAEEAVNVNEIDRTQTEESLKTLVSELAAVGADAVRRAGIQRNIDVEKAKLLAIQ